MRRLSQAGLSLIELLLLLSVVAVFFALSFSYDVRRTEKFKIDKTVLQMQQILDAGLLYYVNNGEWPNYDTACIITPLFGQASQLQQTNGSYLSPGDMPTVFGADSAALGITNAAYFAHAASSATTGLCADLPKHTFGVFAWFTSSATGASAKELAMAKAIAAKLPHGFISSSSQYIGAYIYPPGQDPNQATALSFAGMFHHGACIPAPTCPAIPGNGVQYQAQVFVTPTSVSGVNDTGSNAVYPISSFTAYVEGDASGQPVAAPQPCVGSTNIPVCPTADPNPASENGLFWRACLQVITSHGDIQATRSDAWGNNVSIAAFTRCAITAEPTGSSFSEFGN